MSKATPNYIVDQWIFSQNFVYRDHFTLKFYMAIFFINKNFEHKQKCSSVIFLKLKIRLKYAAIPSINYIIWRGLIQSLKTHHMTSGVPTDLKPVKTVHDLRAYK